MSTALQIDVRHFMPLALNIQIRKVKNLMSMAQSIGNQIRMRRSILRISQDALGTSLTPPMKQQVISKIERGRKEPSASQLFQISHQLGVPVSYFFEGICPPEPMFADNVRHQPEIYSPSTLGHSPLKRQGFK